VPYAPKDGQSEELPRFSQGSLDPAGGEALLFKGVDEGSGMQDFTNLAGNVAPGMRSYGSPEEFGERVDLGCGDKL